MHDHRALRRLALRQHGLITQEQAAARGMSRRAWYAAPSAGRLITVAPRVAALPGAAVTPEQRILAAVLTAGPGALASHRSAAHLWNIEGFADAPVDLLLTDRNRSCSLAGVCVHTPTDLDDLRPIVRSGIPTTNPLRLLVDLGQVAPDAVPAKCWSASCSTGERLGERSIRRCAATPDAGGPASPPFVPRSTPGTSTADRRTACWSSRRPRSSRDTDCRRPGSTPGSGASRSTSPSTQAG